MKYLNAFLAVVFALFAAVQFNDTDPLVWIAVYTAVAVLCALAFLGRLSKWPVIVVTVIVAGWMLTLLPGFIDWIRMGTPTITGTMKAGDPHIEVVREFLGLAVALLTLLHLLRLAIRRP